MKKKTTPKKKSNTITVLFEDMPWYDLQVIQNFFSKYIITINLTQTTDNKLSGRITIGTK